MIMMAFKKGLKVRYSSKYLSVSVTTRCGKSGRDSLVSEQSSCHPVSQFCCQRHSFDHEAPLTFRGMEEKLRIFNKTQGVVARYGDPPQIMSYRDASSGCACQSSRRLVKEARARSLGQEDLERRFLNGFLDDSKDRPCITTISRCTRICT
ncbi:hypothetical protein TIFTF001_048705 [Ficus carica]|uniref:Uncharacterized protein n=2 Tax=Ficus carica TaxID=3494 RepID=A0AA87Z8W1_FICCA|nr:hypothetical protein TIFTF001_048704 [Ficus carica]GMN20186.1 hypothetical protein TIFTF001_048705 [Ficus carica]